MTKDQLANLSKQMARAQRATDDPVLKSLYGMVKAQARGLLKGTGGPTLRALMMRSLSDLEIELSARERRSKIRVVK